MVMSGTDGIAGIAGEEAASQDPIADWRHWLENVRQLDLEQQLYITNAWWNTHIQYQRESRGEDQWQTPEETLARGAGDCEDLAIGKYVTLRECGVPTEQLRLLCCRLRGEAHMALAYYENNEQPPLILDNQSEALFPLPERTDLLPVYEVSEQGLWVNGQLANVPHLAFDKTMERTRAKQEELVS